MELKTTRYEKDQYIATIQLSRPHRRNAWTGRMHTEYRYLLEQAEKDDNVRVIIVTGDPEGKAFCAGADIAALQGHSEKEYYDSGIQPDIATPGYGVRPEFDALFAYHFGLTKPVIACINGAAAGIGLVLACYADIRFAAEGTKFTTAHGRFNFPAEFGLSWILPRLVGLTHANDLLLTSRVFLAGEALKMNLLNAVHPPGNLISATRDYASNMATSVAPGSLRETKKQIYRDQHRSVREAVENSEHLLETMITHADYKEGLRAWTGKRRAKWTGGQ